MPSPKLKELAEFLEIDPEELKGDSGDKGDDYVLTEEDKRDIAEMIEVPVVEKVIEKTTEVIREQPIVTEVTKVTNEIKEVAVPETTEAIVEKLQAFEGDAWLDKSAVRGIEELEKAIAEKNTARTGWGAHPLVIQESGTVKTKIARTLNFTGATVTQGSDGSTAVDIQTPSDARYVKKAGDTMTGALTVANLVNALNSGNYPMYFQSNIVDPGTPVTGFQFNTTNTLQTYDNRVFSVMNNGDELFHIYGGPSASQSGVSIGANAYVTGGGSAIGALNDAYGIYSFALGYSSEASNLGALAMGFTPTVSGLYAVGLGYGPNVSGSFALGLGSAIVEGSTAVGIGSVTASGSNAVAIGSTVVAKGNFSIGIGYRVVAQGLRSISIGTGTTSTGNRNSVNSTVALFTNDAYPRFFFNKNRSHQGAGTVSFGNDLAVGADLLTNGTFTGSATGWTLGLGWSYSANTVIYNSASGTGTLSQTFSGLTTGRVYVLTYTFSALTGSDVLADRMTSEIDLSLGGVFNNQIAPITTQEFFVAEASTHTVTFTPTVTTGPLTATIDNVSVKECLTGQASFAGNLSARWASLGGAGTPTAYLTLAAGTTSAPPISLTSGSLKTTPIAGAMEFLTDRLTFTGTTGTTRKDIADFVYRAITALRTLDGSDELVDCTANSFTVTLPTAVGFTKEYTIKNSGTGIITLATTSSQTIDGSASGVLTLNQYDSITLRSNGANWIIT